MYVHTYHYRCGYKTSMLYIGQLQGILVGKRHITQVRRTLVLIIVFLVSLQLCCFQNQKTHCVGRLFK